MPKRLTAVSFTGGKDSTLVHHLLQRPDAVRDYSPDVEERLQLCAGCEVVLLVTFVPAGNQKPFKAHPLDIIKLQAEALGMQHVEMEVTAPYLESYKANIQSLYDQYGVTLLATGDILDVCNNFMSRAAEGTDVQLLTPLWAIERRVLLDLVWQYRLQAQVSCVNITRFTEKPLQASQQPSDTAACGASAPPADVVDTTSYGSAPMAVGLHLLGQILSPQLFEEVILPAKQKYGVDECGEMGEYHTMVLDGLLFQKQLMHQTTHQQEGEYCFVVSSNAVLANK